MRIFRKVFLLTALIVFLVFFYHNSFVEAKIFPLDIKEKLFLFFSRIAEKLLAQVFQGSSISLEKGGFVYILNGNPSGIERYGNYVYMVLNETVRSPLVYDISQPDKPKLVNMVPAQGWPTKVRMVEGTKWLWVVHGNTWAFYDISDPSNPRLSGTDEGPKVKFVPRGADNLPTSFRQHPNMTYNSVANENILFYGRQSGSDMWIEIYDISNPSQPKFLSKINNAIPRKLRGNLLFAFGSYPTSSRVQVYDVSNPSSPRLISKIDDMPDEIKNLGFGFDDHIDYSPSEKIMTIGIKKSIPKPYWGITLTDSRMGGTMSGVAVYDVSDWNSPKLLGFGYYGTNEKERLINMDDHVYANGFVYGSDLLGYLVVFDVRDPKNIKLVYQDKQGGELGASAYVPERNVLLITSTLWSAGGMYIVDVSDPDSPKLLGHIHHIGTQWANRFGVYKGRYAYFPVGARYIGSPLYVVDFNDPQNPQIVNILWNYGGYNDVLVVDDYLYHSGGNIFYLKDDPTKPQILSNKLPASGNALYYREPYLFLVNPYGSSTLYIIDISRRDQPQLVSKVVFSGTDHRVTSITALNNYIFIGGNAVRAVDISDIKNPKIIGEWGSQDIPILAEQKQVWSDGQYLYVGTYHSEITAFDIKNIEVEGKPKMIYKLTGLPTAWTMNGDPERNLIFRIALYGVSVIKIKKQGQDTTPPATPQNVKAELTNSQIKVSWNSVTDSDLKDYILYRKKDNENLINYKILSSSTNFYIDVDVSPSSTYSYAIASRDFSNNISNLSDLTAPIHIPQPPQNKPPKVKDLDFVTNEDTPIDIKLEATDEENNPLSYSIESLPKNGSLTGTPPNLTYIPKENFYGTDNFSYRAFDQSSYSNLGKINIKINPINDPPTKPVIIYPLDNSTTTPETLFIFRSSDFDSKKIKYSITLQDSQNKNKSYSFETRFYDQSATTSFELPENISLSAGNWKAIIKAIDQEGSSSDEAFLNIYVNSAYNKPPTRPEIIYPDKEFTTMPFLLIVASTTDEDDQEVYYIIEIYKKSQQLVKFNPFTKEGTTLVYTFKERYKTNEPAFFATFLPRGIYKIIIKATDGKSISKQDIIQVRIAY